MVIAWALIPYVDRLRQQGNGLFETHKFSIEKAPLLDEVQCGCENNIESMGCSEFDSQPWR